jgi:YD repeat-containing protein
VLEFRDVFGMRFVGLVDSSGAYATYRVPNPQAPYPQDYVIDQQGIVRYWADQFDPQEVIRVIDRLLGAGVEEVADVQMAGRFRASPNPFRWQTTISLPVKDGVSSYVAVYNAAGRLVRTLNARGRGSVSWDGRDEAGRKAPAGVYYGCGTAASRWTPARLTRLD